MAGIVNKSTLAVHCVLERPEYVVEGVPETGHFVVS